MRHAIATLCIGLLAAALWWGWGDANSGGDSGADTASDAGAGAVSDADSVADAVSGDVAPTRPHSLRGTQIDGALSVDALGYFYPTSATLMLFDYFLSAEGELSASDIRALVLAEARRTFRSDQVDEAMRFFDKYLRYRTSAADIGDDIDRDDLSARLKALQELQREIFGKEVAERVFKRQNDLAQHTFERHAIHADDSLSAHDKVSAVAALDAKLPPDVQRTRKQASQPQKVAKVVQQMRADGLSQEEIDAYRADEFGAESVARFAKLDTKRAEWTARLNAYRQERDAALEGIQSDSERKRITERVRETHFEGTEILRVKALDNHGL